MVEDLIIYQKLVDLGEYVHPLCNKFPKNQRFVLGQQVQNKIIQLATVAIKANKAKEKSALLENLDTELCIFKFLIRLSYSLGMISVHQYEHVSKLSSEIGRLVGGWQRKFK